MNWPSARTGAGSPRGGIWHLPHGAWPDLTAVAHRLAHAKYSLAENLHFSADSRQLRFNSGSTRRTVWDIREAADGPVTLEGTGADGTQSPHHLIAASLNGHWETTMRLDEKTAHYYLWRDGKITKQVKRKPNPHPVDWHSRLLSPDGKWAAFGCMTVESAPVPGFTYVVHFDADNHRTLLSEKASHVHLAISPDSRWLVGGEGTDYVIWDTTTWQKVIRRPRRTSPTACPAAPPSARMARCSRWRSITGKSAFCAPALGRKCSPSPRRRTSPSCAWPSPPMAGTSTPPVGRS